jgi:hypothetical protein
MTLRKIKAKATQRRKSTCGVDGNLVLGISSEGRKKFFTLHSLLVRLAKPLLLYLCHRTPFILKIAAVGLC